MMLPQIYREAPKKPEVIPVLLLVPIPDEIPETQKKILWGGMDSVMETKDKLMHQHQIPGQN